MSTAGRPDANQPGASDIACDLQDAEFVRLVADADGDGVAAAVLLSKCLNRVEVPYQLSVTPLPERADRETDVDLTIGVGRPVTDADLAVGAGRTCATRSAAAIAAECEVSDLILTLVGIVADGDRPDTELLDTAREHGIERRPGVAIPPVDLPDGLAHSTLLHCELSGDVGAARSAVADLGLEEMADDKADRAVASLVALTVGADGDAPPRAARRVERILRPLAGGPFNTIGGYADVLNAVVGEQPGFAVQLALGTVEREKALSLWRTHANRVHGTIDAATTARYDGLFVLRSPGRPPVGAVGRLTLDYRSPEPVVLVVGDGIAAVIATEQSATHVGESIRTAAGQLDGRGVGTPTKGRATFTADPTEFVAEYRDSL
jgi:hypothetical protein